MSVSCSRQKQAAWRCVDWIDLSIAELPAHFAVWLSTSEAAFLSGRFVWANWDARELLTRKKEVEGSMLLRVLLNGVEM